ncbi:hypothetical protein [Alkalihalophilus marmarensis]|uniref:RNA dependent RNA polymerase n=1 Tax=Alkalihalophilus marmarensis DSM 21297 TaxID=1188261 RepID=U6SSF3_9BACI|nr:hypothetical protein [Alkalihalophilus marmarensis]ERN54307.1 hypothetical protein A33I_07725 [Alkalihalophilus marmarensis DSM 21297]
MTETNNLNKQIQIYSLTTECFLNDVEYEIFSAKRNLQFSLSHFKEGFKELESEVSELNDVDKLNQFAEDFVSEYSIAGLHNKLCIEQQKEKPSKSNISKYHQLITFANEYIDQGEFMEVVDIIKLQQNEKLRNAKIKLFKAANKKIAGLKKQLDAEADKVSSVRELRESEIKKSNLISQFESALTRQLNIKQNTISTDIIMIRAFRYKVFESLVLNGFTYLGEHYKYYTSSAGNIRNKKSIFIRSSIPDAVINSITAGLTVDEINSKGGMNVNKYNAYMALSMTASKRWDKFHDELLIDKTIVVDDFETLVTGEVDVIDSDTYDIKRQSKAVSIPHTDGAGICLPCVSDKATQIRLPFLKGLLVPFDYTEFIQLHKGATPTVKDIWGDTYDVIKDDIQIILTKSQLKMWRFFDSWKDYKQAFKQYGCEASIAAEEPYTYRNQTTSYQVLQTLTSTTDSELKQLASYTVDSIKKIGQDSETMLRILGATQENKDKNGLQEALFLYPNLLNDSHAKATIKEVKRSMITRAKAGKLTMPGAKRTYIAPDVYAFAEWLFIKNKEPKGLLKKDEVSCKLYKNNEKLDVLRSPHLYREHSVRKNTIDKKSKEWFVSNCIYTSIHDHISLLLMFDVDGDDALIINDPLFVSIAEREMKDIVPLQYELKAAKEERITNENIYKNLISAYSKNIGEYSNNISKVWNSKVWKHGTDEEKEKAMDIIKWLTFENNATIDYAKSLWMPVRPQNIAYEIKRYTSEKLAHFFIHAKDKEVKQVEALNDSVVNRLEDIIPSTKDRIHFNKVVDDFEINKVMFNQSFELSGTEDMITELYNEINKKKSNELRKLADNAKKTQKAMLATLHNDIKEQFKQIDEREEYITDVLISYLYKVNKSISRSLLWDCYGRVIVNNLERNLDNLIVCEDCQTTVPKTKQRQIRCDNCQGERQKEKDRKRKKLYRKSEKMSA